MRLALIRKQDNILSLQANANKVDVVEYDDDPMSVFLYALRAPESRRRGSTGTGGSGSGATGVVDSTGTGGSGFGGTAVLGSTGTGGSGSGGSGVSYSTGTGGNSAGTVTITTGGKGVGGSGVGKGGAP